MPQAGAPGARTFAGRSCGARACFFPETLSADCACPRAADVRREATPPSPCSCPQGAPADAATPQAHEPKSKPARTPNGGAASPGEMNRLLRSRSRDLSSVLPSFHDLLTRILYLTFHP